MNVKQYITGHCTILSHNSYCIAINRKNCNNSVILAPTPQRKSFSFVRLPLYPETRSPWCGLRHWFQWEKMISFFLPLFPGATRTAFLCVFFTLPQADSLSFSLCLFISLLYFPPPKKALDNLHLCIRVYKLFFMKLKVFFRLPNKLNSAQWYTQTPLILQLDKLGPQSTLVYSWRTTTPLQYLLTTKWGHHEWNGSSFIWQTRPLYLSVLPL